MKIGRWILAAMLAVAAGGAASSFAEDKKAADKPKYTEGSCCDKAAKNGKECAHKCCVAAKEKGEVCTKCNKPAEGDKK
jgi:hypothetical protein